MDPKDKIITRYSIAPLNQEKIIELSESKIVLPKGTSAIAYEVLGPHLQVYPRNHAGEGFGVFHLSTSQLGELEKAISSLRDLVPQASHWSRQPASPF